MAGQDYYKILGVSKDTDTAQIKAAYRDLAFKFHPDRNQGDLDTQDKMKALNEAYAVLSDTKKRRDYDALQQQYGSAGAYTHFRQTYSEQDIFSGTDINKVFEELAKSFGLRNFEEISKEFYGKNNAFEFKDANVHFKGFFFSGTVNPGRAFSRMNAPGLLARAAQTLLNNISGGQIPQRSKDIHDTIRIDPDLAEKGGSHAYYHKQRAKKLIVKIPPGIRHGQQIRLGGMGGEDSRGNGDLYLKVDVKQSILNYIRKHLPF